MGIVCTFWPPSDPLLLTVWAGKLIVVLLMVSANNQVGRAREHQGPPLQEERAHPVDLLACCTFSLKMCLGSWFFAGK